MKMNCEYAFKFIFIGEKGCGKTWLVRSWCGLRQVNDVDTNKCVVIDNYKKIVEEEFTGTRIMIHINDSSGDISYRPILRRYLPIHTCVIIVYDVDCRKSFDRLSYWFQIAKEEAKSNQVHYMIVGVGKRPKHQSTFMAVSTEDIENWIKMIDTKATHMTHFQVFTDTAQIIDDEFNELISEIFTDVQRNRYNSLTKAGITCIRSFDMDKPRLVLAPSPPTARRRDLSCCCEKNDSEPCIKFCSLL